jgi:hypothetical protein
MRPFVHDKHLSHFVMPGSFIVFHLKCQGYIPLDFLQATEQSKKTALPIHGALDEKVNVLMELAQRHIPGSLHGMAVSFVFQSNLIKAGEKVVEMVSGVCVVVAHLLKSRYDLKVGSIPERLMCRVGHYGIFPVVAFRPPAMNIQVHRMCQTKIAIT